VRRTASTAASRPRRRARAGRPARRLPVLLVALLALFVLVLVRLAQVQVVGADRYVALGESQRVRSVVLAADRGSIFDRNGNDLALSVPQRTVWADPRLIADPTTVAAALAPILGSDAATLESRLASDRSFVYLARRVDDAAADAVADLEIDGISFLEEPRRFTPAGHLAHGVLGSVGVDNEGLSGLELQYEDVLSGTPGELILERAPDGSTIPGGRQHLTPAARGDDLVLTIDRSMQFHAERALRDQIVRMGAKGGVVVVSNPATGEVLAMANLRTDPETGEVAPSGNNAALTEVYEPGSVNKVITMSAALEEGVVEPDTVFTVPDRLQVSDHLFGEAKPRATASYTATQILAKSSNIGTIMIGQELGKERIDRYLRSFGFGTRTGLGFPNEAAGLLLDTDRWSGTSIGSIPIGQGVAVTAMQMLWAYNVIANEGRYVPPRLVSARIDGDGERHELPGGDERRVVSQQTALQMRAMLAEAVRDGTGGSAAIDGYTVAGKTGTARKPQPNGGYRDEAGNYHYVATFAGFVPAENPQLSAIVVIDEPSASIYGGSTAAPVFADVARYGLRLFTVPPEQAAKDQALAGSPAAPVRSTAATLPSTTTTTAAPGAGGTGSGREEAAVVRGGGA
jgi:cell division protein FtsI (penicillin-binding protein 3)